MPISWTRAIGMRLREVPVSEMRAALATIERHNLPMTLDQIEAHYLAGGNVDAVLRAALKAQQRGHRDYVLRLFAADLAGEDLDTLIENGYVTQAGVRPTELIERAEDDPRAAAELDAGLSEEQILAVKQMTARLRDSPLFRLPIYLTPERQRLSRRGSLYFILGFALYVVQERYAPEMELLLIPACGFALLALVYEFRADRRTTVRRNVLALLMVPAGLALVLWALETGVLPGFDPSAAFGPGAVAVIVGAAALFWGASRLSRAPRNRSK